MKKSNVRVIIDGKEFTQAEMDIWKKKRLDKACRTLHVNVGYAETISDLNRNLTDIKAQLSYDEMLKILGKKLALSRFVMKLAAVLSGRRRRAAKTTILADGISAETFSRILDALMTEPTEEYRRVNLSVYPEHYVLRPGSGTLEVIETTGNAPIPTQFFITFSDEQGLAEPRNSQYTHQSVGTAKLSDGTIIGGVRHQFRDTSVGVECSLLVEFPALCPKAIVSAHEKHLAVEFTNWISWIAGHQDRY